MTRSRSDHARDFDEREEIPAHSAYVDELRVLRRLVFRTTAAGAARNLARDHACAALDELIREAEAT